MTLQVVNLTGQVVHTIYQGTLDKGAQLVEWDAGSALPAGVYSIQLKTANELQTKRVTFMK